MQFILYTSLYCTVLLLCCIFYFLVSATMNLIDLHRKYICLFVFCSIVPAALFTLTVVCFDVTVFFLVCTLHQILFLFFSYLVLYYRCSIVVVLMCAFWYRVMYWFIPVHFTLMMNVYVVSIISFIVLILYLHILFNISSCL